MQCQSHPRQLTPVDSSRYFKEKSPRVYHQENGRIGFVPTNSTLRSLIHYVKNMSIWNNHYTVSSINILIYLKIFESNVNSYLNVKFFKFLIKKLKCYETLPFNLIRKNKYHGFRNKWKSIRVHGQFKYKVKPNKLL